MFQSDVKPKQINKNLTRDEFDLGSDHEFTDYVDLKTRPPFTNTYLLQHYNNYTDIEYL